MALSLWFVRRRPGAVVTRIRARTPGAQAASAMPAARLPYVQEMRLRAAAIGEDENEARRDRQSTKPR